MIELLICHTFHSIELRNNTMRRRIARWLPPLRARTHFGFLLIMSLYSFFRNAHTLQKMEKIAVPKSPFSPKRSRRIVFLEDSLTQRGLRYERRNETTASRKRTMELRHRHMIDDDIPPPRESWSHPASENSIDTCVPMEDWMTSSFPNCNEMHAHFSVLDRVTDRRFSDTNVAKMGPILLGSRRHNWKVPISDNNVVLKTLKIGKDFDEDNHERHRLDALAMERLSSSPNVINIYSFCGMSSVTEYGDGGTLESLVSKGEVTSREKLVHAVDLAQSVSEAHDIGFVHRDLDATNFIVVKGKLKLNDFNLAHFLRWNNVTNATCDFATPLNGLRKGYREAASRSPEELLGNPLSQSSDVYGIGALLFFLLTTSKPYYCEGGDYCFVNKVLGDDEIHKLKAEGILPRLPTHIAQSDAAEITSMRHVLGQTLAADPEARPLARSVANSLRQSLMTLDDNFASLECPAFESSANENDFSGSHLGGAEWEISLSKPRVYLAGLVRDASSISEELFDKLVELNCRHGFGIHIVAESGKDHAFIRYQELKSHYINATEISCAPFVIIEEPDDLQKTVDRTNRVDTISYLRDYQRVHLHVAFNRNPTDRDIVILVDFDLFSIPPVETITEEACKMIHRRDHDVVCATGLMHRPFGYYDTFATIIKPDTFVYPRKGRLIHSRRGENLNMVRSDDLFGTVTQEHLLAYFENEKYQTSNGAVPVKSCFGGMAFYRASKWFMPQCSYSMSTAKLKEYANKSDGRPCEHVVFHLCLSKHDKSTQIVVQPNLRTLWDEPMEVTNRIVSGNGFRGGLMTVSKRAFDGSRLVNGHFSLRINEKGMLVVEDHTMNTTAPDIVWTADANADYFHDKWSSMFLTIGKDGLLKLIQQVQRVRKDLPFGECKLVDADGTSCRVIIWSSNVAGPKGQYYLELGKDGSLRVFDTTRKILWANDGGMYSSIKESR